MHMSARAKRHNLIASLVAKGGVASQDALQRLLAADGVQATQATLSRDLREMGVVKGPAGYMLPAALGAGNWGELDLDAASVLPEPVRRAVQDFVVNVTPAVGLIVLKTGPGHAQLVGVALDRFPPPGVAGTIAGDDTIFVAVDTAEHLGVLLEACRAAVTSSSDLAGASA